MTIQNLLQLTLPSTYQFAKGQGVDSDIYYIISDRKDSILVAYGQKGIINDLYDEPVAVWPDSLRKGLVERLGKEPGPDEVLFSEFPEDDNKQRIFEKNYFMYDTVNTIVVKIVQPKRVGEGITGLNIPKLKDGMSFTIRGDNLDSTTHKTLVTIFRTLKYK
ncbi:MAG: hypothetical protein EOO46_15940 [Flavobacterium sp.]|nr:MAG: hypothetical protein EOO46_15940 [Flavobacterium sp.]